MTESDILERLAEIIAKGTAGTDSDGSDPWIDHKKIAAAIMREFTVSPGWMPIDLAPHGSKPIELYRPPVGVGGWAQRVVAVWHQFDEPEDAAWIWPIEPTNDGWWEKDRLQELIESGAFYEDAKSFTHWQPLPSPPADEDLNVRVG